MVSAATSVEYNPFVTWQCPHCQCSYVKGEVTKTTAEDIGDSVVGNNNHGAPSRTVFYRGTCQHDVCVKCIANVSSLISKTVKSEESGEQPIFVAVTCPIVIDHDRHHRRCSGGRSCQGQFHVDLAQIIHSRSNRNLYVIEGMITDLCDGNAGVVRVGSRDQIQQSSDRGIVSVKDEVIIQQEQHFLSNRTASFPLSSSISPPSTIPHTPSLITRNSITVKKENSNLKPLFEEGDDVVSAWWNPITDGKRRKKTSWYPGKVISYKSIEDANASSKYGPSRLYHIMFTDGDELDNIEDYYVFSKTDYELTTKFEVEGLDYIGVKRRVDKNSNDIWAKLVGWYEIKGEDGKVQSFPKLADAMKAHDAIVVRRHGAQTKRSFLNIPEDHDYLFPSANSVHGDEILDARSTRKLSTNIVSPESGSFVKMTCDSNDGCEKVLFNGKNKDDTHHDGQEVKRRRFDPSEFWCGNGAQIPFTEQAFMNNSLFHLNSFIRSKGTVKLNEAFAEFIREGVATPGFDRVPKTLDIEKITDWTYHELRDALIQHGHHDEWGASQVALWLKNATIGSFVIMRHEYPKCPFCPKRLIGDDGKYIGPVYVIGVITKKVVPWSEEERDIENNKMGEFSRGRYPIYTVCKIEWKRMGYKSELEESTQSYINHVCQPTLRQICKLGKMFAGGTSSERIRCDLWRNATEEISSEDFPDEFEHDGEDNYW